MTEPGLPRMRLEGELGRTTGQLRLFAALVHKAIGSTSASTRPTDCKPALRSDLVCARSRSAP